jgi:hypothetical protein
MQPLNIPPEWETNSLSAFVKCDPKFTTEYFEVRGSTKGGLGAFALKEITKGRILLKE